MNFNAHFSATTKTLITAVALAGAATFAPAPAQAAEVSGPVHPRCHVVTWNVEVYEDEDENPGETAHGGDDADYFPEATMRERCPAKPGVRLTIMNGITDVADIEPYDDGGSRVWGFDSVALAEAGAADHSGLVVSYTSARSRKVFVDRTVVTWLTRSANEDGSHQVSSRYRKVIRH